MLDRAFISTMEAHGFLVFRRLSGFIAQGAWLPFGEFMFHQAQPHSKNTRRALLEIVDRLVKLAIRVPVDALRTFLCATA